MTAELRAVRPWAPREPHSRIVLLAGSHSGDRGGAISTVDRHEALLGLAR